MQMQMNYSNHHHLLWSYVGSRMSESDYDNMESVKLSENRNLLTRFPDSCMKTKRSESTDLPKVSKFSFIAAI